MKRDLRLIFLFVLGLFFSTASFAANEEAILPVRTHPAAALVAAQAAARSERDSQNWLIRGARYLDGNGTGITFCVGLITYVGFLGNSHFLNSPLWVQSVTPVTPFLAAFAVYSLPKNSSGIARTIVNTYRRCTDRMRAEPALELAPQVGTIVAALPRQPSSETQRIAPPGGISISIAPSERTPSLTNAEESTSVTATPSSSQVSLLGSQALSDQIP